MITNNIINLNDDWPLDSNSFHNYLLEKYGSEEKIYEVHHYETLGAKDVYDREVFPAGLIVDKTFYDAPEYKDITQPPAGVTFPDVTSPGTLAELSAVVGISNTIISISIDDPGLGYQSNPTITISDPPITLDASAGSTINQFRVSSIVSLNGGQGYNTAPQVTFTDPPASTQATASCGLGTGVNSSSVQSITSLSGGSGYGLTTPTVTFDYPLNALYGFYANESSISIGTEVEGMYVRSDGIKVYTASVLGSNQIKEYTLSVGWSAATTSSTSSLDVSADFSYCNGIEFSTDGTKMFVSGGLSGNYKIVRYNLSTSWDITTASKVSEISTNSPGGLRFKPDGLVLFILDASTPDIIKSYPLSVAWDITTIGSLTSSYQLTTPTNENNVLGFTFNSNGTKIFAAGSDNASLYEFNLSSWDLTTTQYSKTFYVGDRLGSPADVYVRSDRERMFVSGGSSSKLFEYNLLGTALGISTLTNGSVSSITVTRSGYGYTVAPSVTLSAPYPAVKATGIASITAGVVTSITITNSGFGYLTSPSVSIESAPISKKALAVATISETGISTIRVVDGGLNYVNGATVTVTYPKDIVNIDPGYLYNQGNKTWRWNGTTWQEKITDEFQYFDPLTSSTVKIAGNVLSKPVTNYEYEFNLNEEKRKILVIKPGYLSVIISDLKQIMKYDRDSVDYISDDLKSTYNPRFTGV
jgi:hypothetical protein